MIQAPVKPKAVAFFDGQNLFHCAKRAFGYATPNYDVKALSEAVCKSRGWTLGGVRFYTGVPSHSRSPKWQQYWSSKLLRLKRSGVATYSRALRYRSETVTLQDGTKQTTDFAVEKGIDVRIAIDIIRLAHSGAYDVVIIFSQDQDLSEAAKEIRHIAREQARWIRIVSAFPDSQNSRNRKGIDGTDWIPLDKTTYEACLDSKD